MRMALDCEMGTHRMTAMVKRRSKEKRKKIKWRSVRRRTTQ